MIGIRTTFVGERRLDFKIVFADEVHEATAADVAKIVHQTVGANKAYLTFDIDCLDPSAAQHPRWYTADVAAPSGASTFNTCFVDVAPAPGDAASAR